MAKTKIFWIAKKVDDATQIWGYNSKRKAEEKGLELFGVGMTDFSFKLDGEEFEDGDGDTAFIYSGQIDSFGHFLLYNRADGTPNAIGLEQERAATEYVEAELPNNVVSSFTIFIFCWFKIFTYPVLLKLIVHYGHLKTVKSMNLKQL